MDGKVSLITANDLFLVPICLLLLYFVAFRIRKKYDGTEIKKYFIAGLTLKLIFTFLYTLTIQYYYKGGDTMMFFQALLDMQNALHDNSGIAKEIYLKTKLHSTDQLVSYFMYDRTGVTHYYMYQVSNFMVPKIGLPFSILFMRSYLCISFMMSFFAFAGCWRLFKLFYSLFPHLHKKMAFATLFLPSVLFWGVALLKDSVCIGALGFFVYAFYQLFMLRRNILVNILILFATAFLLFFIKPYIILSAFPAFLIWIFFILNRKIIDKGVRALASFIFITVAIIGSLFFLQNIASSEIASQYATQNIIKAVEIQQGTYSQQSESGSYFEVGEIDNSILGFLLLFPTGLIATLFRPFIWELRSPVMLLTALESFMFLWLTIQCFRFITFKKFRQLIGEYPVLAFCLVYSILFAGFVGMTTLNFGTLARYKIPALPMYLVLIFVLLDKSGKVKPSVIIHRKLF